MVAIALILFGARIATAQTLTLSPASAANVVGTSHTVTATLTGATGHCAEFGECTGGGPSDGNFCKTTADCDPLDTCSGVVDPDPDETATPCGDDATCAAISRR